MAYHCVARNTDEFLHQLTRLVGNGHYFYFSHLLDDQHDPTRLDQKIVDQWKLDVPYWKRTAKYRRGLPSIHYLRYGRFYVLLASKGRLDGESHPFFVEYPLMDIRRHSLHCFGYGVRYALSRATGKRQIFVRLEKEARQHLRTDLVRKCTSQRYGSRDALEEEVRTLPYQWYQPVRTQLKTILREVNKVRRRSGLSQIRFDCVPDRMRPPQRFSCADGLDGTGGQNDRKPE
jgi:hypothetical protein